MWDPYVRVVRSKSLPLLSFLHLEVLQVPNYAVEVPPGDDIYIYILLGLGVTYACFWT